MPTPDSAGVFAEAVRQHRDGRPAAAEALYRQVVAAAPGHAEALNMLGVALCQLGRPAEGVEAMRRSVAINARNAGYHTNLGIGLKDLGRIDDALVHQRIALVLDPNSAVAHSNLGDMLMQVAKPAEAAASFRRALQLDPGAPQARVNLAGALLWLGDMPAAWEAYEWRWQGPDMIAARRDFTQPQWRGEPAAGRTLLLHAEQGFGDTLQFCRYAPLAAARGLRVVLEAPARLIRLLHSLPGVAHIVARGEPLPAFDLHCPMLSMPLALGTTLAAIPATVPYLHADPAQVAAWRGRLDALPARGKRVGLVWAGNPRLHDPALAAADRRRSIAPERLAPLWAVPGLHFVSLQRDGPAAPKGLPLTDVMAEMADFADTAALIANLDLVVSVDTAVAHLAAALGKPVWLLNRFDSCWRWLTERRDSPWYPTLRLYRQPRHGDWETVVADVVRDLRSLGG